MLTDKKELGFGCMRLPLLDSKNPLSFDYHQCEKMADEFLDGGFDYFDTAYMYHNKMSEKAVSRFVSGRYKRNSFRLADKLPPWEIHKQGDALRIFNEQLDKCGVGYFDFYLLHCLTTTYYKSVKRFNLFDFVLQQKALGKIKHVGFSFHDTPELLDEILTDHPEAEFVQLQINYLDFEDAGVQSRACYEVALKHKKPIIVMEPVKGGTLANLPKEAADILREVQPDWSPASWAFRFVLSLENVFMVLSGMSDIAQMRENIATFKDFSPLNQKEQQAILRVREILTRKNIIPCTSCRYCVEDCPKQIAIPDIFSLVNSTSTNRAADYATLTKSGGKAMDCIACGRCEKACPQQIKIISLLKQISNDFHE